MRVIPLRRSIRLVEHNEFDLIDDEFILPHMYCDLLVRSAKSYSPQLIVKNVMNAEEAIQFANAIERIPRDEECETILALFGDPGGGAMEALCKFLREGAFEFR